MEYTFEEMNLLKDWITTAGDELTNNGYDINGLADDKIGILYLTYLKRIVTAQPREILKPESFDCPTELQQGLMMLEEKILGGENLRPHLSKLMDKVDFQDKMLFDWDIHHFHLGVNLNQNGYVDRTGPLLYARVTDDKIYFIKIAEHDKWSDKDLITIIHENWPESISSFRSSAEVLEHNYDSEEIGKLRKANVNTILNIASGINYYGPGWGMASSGDSADAVNSYLNMLHRFRDMEKSIKSDLSKWFPDANTTLSSNNLRFKLFKKDGKFWLCEMNNDACTQINEPL